MPHRTKEYFSSEYLAAERLVKRTGITVELYESVTKQFPPHMVATSSKPCEEEPAARKYLSC
jgi:hypothetical protein